MMTATLHGTTHRRFMARSCAFPKGTLAEEKSEFALSDGNDTCVLVKCVLSGKIVCALRHIPVTLFVTEMWQFVHVVLFFNT